jgi:hypothetical protein
VYILVYDEEALLQLLARTEIAGGSRERARQYLEKVVESKVSVPRLTRTQWVDQLLNPLIAHGLETHPMFTSHSAAFSEFEWRIESLAWRKVATPRQIERLLDAVRGLPEELRGEVNYLDWCLISLLRVAYPGVWQTVIDHPDVFAGLNVGASLRTLAEGEKDRAKQVAQTVGKEAETPYDLDDLLDLLDYLFPRFAHNRTDGSGYASGSSTEEHQNIGDPAYFDRYFAHQFPRGEVADMTVRSQLAQLDRSSEAGSATEALTRLFEEEPSATLRTIRRRWREAASPSATFAFLRTLAASPELRNVNDGPFGIPGTSVLRMLAGDVLSMETESSLEVLKLRDAGTLDPLIVELALAPGPTYGSAHYVEWMASQRQVLENRAFNELVTSDCLQNDFAVRESLQRLRRLNPDRAREVSKDALTAGRWRGDDLVGTAVAYSYSGPNDKPTLRALRVTRTIVDYDDLVRLVAEGERAPYPADWDEDLDQLVGPDTRLRELGSYALAHWDRATIFD